MLSVLIIFVMKISLLTFLFHRSTSKTHLIHQFSVVMVTCWVVLSTLAGEILWFEKPSLGKTTYPLHQGK